MKALSHSDNTQRLATLYSYDVLDTDAELDFDEIVALASQICEVPISLVSLVGEDRQWFKAKVGLDNSETSLDTSVCAHAILEQDYLEIPDLTEDARSADMDLVKSNPAARFYAGANLIAFNGLPLGTLCVLDTKPRKLTPLQRQTLRVLARQVVTQLELRARLKTEKALRGEMDHRVKNSLQTLSSILRMSSRSITDPEAGRVLEMLDRRMTSVAALHSELMGQEGEDYVDATTYLTRVTDLLKDTAPSSVSIECRSDPVPLLGRQASAIGMIVSEFVANSIKHAFPDARRGRVTIVLAMNDDRTAVLRCADDGIGNRAVSPRASGDDTLGKKLIDSAAIQLGGDMERDICEDGARLSLSFMVNPQVT